jgi:uncharacterized OsmC-like protein
MTARPSPVPSPTAHLVLPAQPPQAFALYAWRPHHGADPHLASAIPAALAARGIAVLIVDLAAAAAADGRTPAADDDISALRLAADMLRAEHGALSILIGHSAAGPAVLAAGALLDDVRAMVTVGSVAPRSRLRSRVPLLVLHAPGDSVVPVGEASRVFAAASHPKSFIALDGADHAVREPRQARHVAGLIAAWAEPYLPDPTPQAPVDPAGSVVVTDAGAGAYTQTVTAGRHVLIADEPVSVGGEDAGPTPYDLLLAALGTCTSMTLRMYADRKGLALERTTVRLRHDRVHAKDCAQTEQSTGMVSRIRRDIEIEGPLSGQDRRRLIEIADRCPVHRTLSSEIVVETT